MTFSQPLAAAMSIASKIPHLHVHAVKWRTIVLPPGRSNGLLPDPVYRESRQPTPTLVRFQAGPRQCLHGHLGSASSEWEWEWEWEWDCLLVGVGVGLLGSGSR